MDGCIKYLCYKNNSLVVERINKIKKKKHATSVRTFDRSTLYTKIPHHLLRDALFEIHSQVLFHGLNVIWSLCDQIW